MKDLVEAGATFLQLEDLGAWLPLFTDDDEGLRVDRRRDRPVRRRRGRQDRVALLLRQRLGQRLADLFPAGYEAVLPHFYDVPIDQFVLDFANRDMADIDCAEVAPGGQGGRRSACSTSARPWSSRREQIADRIRKVIEVVPPERVYLTTDCGMKPLARMVAKMKLRALVEGARIVRDEIGVTAV